MQKHFARAALAALAAAALCAGTGSGAGTDTQPTQYVRETPIVKAVKKTRDGIVTIHAMKRRDYGVTRDLVGTGVIVDARGYAVTNKHVVSSGERFTATLADGTELNCTVFAADSRYDLA